MKRFTLSSMAFVALMFAGACSKKKTKEDADAANATVQPTDLGAQVGAPIPELPAVYFAYDSFNLTGDAKSALNKHAAWLKANATRLVQIEGHTDERGTTEYNLALGERRSGTVKDYLVGQGIPASQLSTISFGEERPAVQGTEETAWSKNRRAEFVSAGR